MYTALHSGSALLKLQLLVASVIHIMSPPSPHPRSLLFPPRVVGLERSSRKLLGLKSPAIAPNEVAALDEEDANVPQKEASSRASSSQP